MILQIADAAAAAAESAEHYTNAFKLCPYRR